MMGDLKTSTNSAPPPDITDTYNESWHAAEWSSVSSLLYSIT